MNMKINTSINHSRNRQLIARSILVVLLSVTPLAQNRELPNSSTGGNALPLHAKWAVEASRAQNARNWETALEKAKECIQRFGDQAEDIQSKLKSINSPMIPTGRITNEVNRREVVARGPLNDVAFCYLIIARAHVAQYHQEPDKELKSAKDLLAQAKKAYVKAMSLTYAYVYAPENGTFWRPAEAASRELKRDPFRDDQSK